MNAKALEKKWRKKWEEAKLFESEPKEDQEKYFVNCPYPYMNGYLHLGHAFTYLRADMVSRYQRMKNKNVLFPFAFHCTGTPIVAAAQRVEEGEEGQISALKQMGLSPNLIKKFSNPEEWTKYFPEKSIEDLKNFGTSIDWRRSFITTSLNPPYDRFIRWQFNKLLAGEYLIKGSFPVVWCPKRETVVGDHDRLSGEGETPQEYTLLKFKGEDHFLVAATLRPETVFGQTNIWVDGKGTYTKAKVGNETWIISQKMPFKLNLQGHDIEELGEVQGQDLVGQKYVAPHIDSEVMVLPSKFCDASIGSGIVTSVPSDSPDDYQGLADLQKSASDCESWGLDHEYVKSIQPVAILDSGEMGTLPAPKLCQDLGIKNQTQRSKLEKAKQELYMHSFNHGVMLGSTGKVAGKPVEEARELVKNELVENGKAIIYYELTGPVQSRWLADCVVKIVDNQWFLGYSDEKWTETTEKALKSMELYPSKSRAQFEYVLQWLKNWACVREKGLGTRLPWDDNWVIESLSDSTIYMAYYTVAHYLKDLKENQLTESLFDAIFGDGNTKLAAEDSGVKQATVIKWRNEFNYWYPYDLRISGKDLIQNHLSFSLFNHTAMFGDDKWPRGFAVNGWVLVEGEKMSKSRGNFFTLKELMSKYGADVVRFTLCNAGEGLDDPNWEITFAETAGKKLNNWLSFVKKKKGKGRTTDHPVDAWFREIMASISNQAHKASERLKFRTSTRLFFFELPQYFKWYLQRTGEPHAELLKEYISVVNRGIAPIVPHTAEEAWAISGEKDFILNQPFPEGHSPDLSLITGEDLVKQTLEDTRSILNIAKIANPKEIVFITAPEWKWTAVRTAGELADERGQVKLNDLISSVMPTIPPESKKLGADFLKKWVLKDIPSLGPGWQRKYKQEVDESKILSSSVDFFANVLNCKISVVNAEEARSRLISKANQSSPLRPAIFVS
ncbi:MAG: leucine--tRNA ligase [Candidatus Thermoplasmatota archaeon]|nr:leucine--tRNA ligase [Candidatus Thermoplasmatota archaeon]